jgi:hypothetical protein
MSKSITNSRPQFAKASAIPRFNRLDEVHIKAIETITRRFPSLGGRLEVHLPGHRAKQIFGSEKLLVWPKFDRRPACYLFFIEGFAPCLWDPSRQEGLTFRWLLNPGFGLKGPTVCLANLLKGESALQIEDLLVYEGQDLWSHQTFTERWTALGNFWNKLPEDQPLLAVKPQLVKPCALEELSARIRSILRRQPSDDADAGASVFGALRLYPLRLLATWKGQPIALSQREFAVLEVLVRRKNQVLTKAQIEEALYGWGNEVESNVVEVYVCMLRRKISPDLIHTIRGVGYQLAPAQLQA